MPRNVEVKVRVDSLESLRTRIAALVSGPGELIEQRDTFFDLPADSPHGASPGANRRLKLREFADGSGELIAYQRPDEAGPKLSRYAIHPTRDPSSLGRILADTLGVRGVVEKRRELFLLGQTRIHLDDVHRLGGFLELEVVLHEGQTEASGREIADAILLQLGIDGTALLRTAYIDLLAERSTR